MAVSRNDNVSSALSRLDSRLNTVENKTLGLSGLSSGVATTAPADTGGSSVTPGPGNTPPKTYTKIIKAYIYGDQTTGAGSRIELYFATPLKTSISLDAENNEVITPLAPGETMRIQGLHSTSGDDFIISPKDFIVQATDTPPWDNADLRLLSTGEVGPGQLRRSWRNTPSTGNNKPSDVTAGETVTFTTWFNPVLAVPKTYTGATELITTRRIDSVSATGSTVTVTLNSTNKFKVGDVIYIDQLSNSAPASTLFGIDGLFKVTATPTSNSIQYELDAPLASPITNFVPATYKYVYPVAQPKVEEGEVWVDKSVEPNRVFVWKELRWYDTADPIGQVTPEQDGIAPSPVTDLAATSELPANATSPVINLTWTPPTTRSNGDPISGFLDGYDIWYKRSTEVVWKKEFVKDGGQGIAAHQIKDAVLLQNFTYNIRVYAVDIMAQYSTAATVNVSTAKFSEVLNAPSKPVVSSKLGTITVEWDGLDSTGNLPVPGIIYIEFHESTSSGFTPSSATLVETLPVTNSGNYVVLTERTMNTEDPSSAPTYYYKTRFVRQISPTELETSAASIQSDGQKVTGVTGPDIVASTVTTNKLEAGFVTASLVRGDVIRAGANATSARVELRSTGISAFNGIPGDPATFTVSASDGSTTITGGTLSAPTITGGTLQTNSIANRGIKITNNNLIAYNSSGTQTFSIDGSNGQVTIASGVSIGGYATDTLSNVTTIDGGKITTGTLDADRISANTTYTGLLRTGAAGTNRIEIRGSTIANSGIVHLAGDGVTSNFRFYANGFSYLNNLELASGTVSGTLTVDGTISGGTIVGGTFRTVPAGNTSKRLIINTSGQIVFFDAGSSSVAGTIEASSNYLSLTTSSGPSLNVTPTSVSLTGTNANLSAGGNVFAGDRVGAFNLRTTSVRFVYTLSDQSGYTQLGAVVSSDERIKKNIETTSLGLNFINDLNPVKFEFINKETYIDNGLQFGVIAQELKETLTSHGISEENGIVYKSFYGEGEEDYLYSVNRDQLIAPLIKAIQELSQQNSELQARIAALEGTT